VKLPFIKPWESAIAVLHDNILGQESDSWGRSFAELKTELNEAPAFIPESDRRVEPRFLLSLPVFHRIKGRVTDSWIKTKSIDISQNGIRLAVESPVPVGSHLELDMKLPNYRKPIRLSGVVVWEKPSLNNGAGYECGVAFENFRNKVSIKGKMINFMADKLCGRALRSSEDMTCRPAMSREDLEAAYRLVYDEYQKRKICQPDPSSLQYSYYCLLPASRTFLLEMDGQLAGTISLIVDSPCGIPMETLFPDKIGKFRQRGHRIAEVSLLALDQKLFGHKTFSLTDMRKLSASFKLFKIIFDYARFEAGVTDLFIAMHPKHQDLYQYLTFEPIGPVRSYSRAAGKPALPMHMDIARAVLTTPREMSIQRYFIEERLSPELLEPHFVWDAGTAREFLFHRRNLWNDLQPYQQAYLKVLYPNLV
jgi:hypothetical protein